MNSLLLVDFGKPENLIKAIKLLSNVSMGVASPSVDLSTIPLALEVRGNLVPNLIAASCRANAHLQDLEENAMANRLKTILSYIILFLTLEHAIVPELQRKDPTQTKKWVDGKKYQYFTEMLQASSMRNPSSQVESPAISGNTLRNHSSYGKTF